MSVSYTQHQQQTTENNVAIHKQLHNHTSSNNNKLQTPAIKRTFGSNITNTINKSNGNTQNNNNNTLKKPSQQLTLSVIKPSVIPDTYNDIESIPPYNKSIMNDIAQYMPRDRINELNDMKHTIHNTLQQHSSMHWSKQDLHSNHSNIELDIVHDDLPHHHNHTQVYELELDGIDDLVFDSI